jgi:hypothetical protein
MNNTRIIWKNRKAMVEQAARIEVHTALVCGKIFSAGLAPERREWFEAHLPQHAAFSTGNVEPSNKVAIEHRFWQDVNKLVAKATREYYDLSKAEREAWRETMRRTMEPPTSAPARIRQVSMAVEVERLPQPVAFGGSIDLELGLAESIKLLNDYQLATNGLWLDMQQGEVD